jgi:predicted Rossmann-fold nucleotide-binding protein
LDKPQGTKQFHRQIKAYENMRFLESKDARALRILAEYLEPLARFKRYGVRDTIVFMGSARLVSRQMAEATLAEAEEVGNGVAAARTALELSTYYEAARELSHRLTSWSKKFDHDERRFVVCTGGGPGIMEAANRGASEAKGLNIGLTISIPNGEFDNPYVSRELHIHFHYLFMRKFWFVLSRQGGSAVPRGFRYARRVLRDAHAGANAQDEKAHADRTVRGEVLERGVELRRAGEIRHNQPW